MLGAGGEESDSNEKAYSTLVTGVVVVVVAMVIKLSVLSKSGVGGQ